MAFYLGIDGGGSKTIAAVADDCGILAAATGPGCSPTRFAPETVREVLRTVIREACTGAQVEASQIVFACVGSAGVSVERGRALIESAFRDVVPCELHLVGDMVIAHEAAFFGAPGVVVIAGTGSMAYGVNQRGETARAGGWGPMISDEGSGTWIGKEAVRMLLRAIDTGQSTMLATYLLRELNASTRDELVRACNSQPAPNFASLFPAVHQAAIDGDALARDLLTQAGMELATLGRIVMRRLWPGETAVGVAMAGGIFQTSPTVRQAFFNTLRSDCSEALVRLTMLRPVIGAVSLARRMAQQRGASAKVQG